MRILNRSLDLLMLLFLVIFGEYYALHYFSQLGILFFPYAASICVYLVYLILKREGLFDENKDSTNPQVIRSKPRVFNQNNINQDPMPIWYYQRKDKPANHAYSEILGRNVDLCCYQAARLNDRYCICGRGVIYPKYS
jgi:hypothetical protein